MSKLPKFPMLVGRTSPSIWMETWAFHVVYCLICVFLLLPSTDDFKWIREVFITGTMGSGRPGRKLDLERDERLTFHLLQRDSQVGNVEAKNVVDAIDHSKRVVIILSA